MKLINDIIGYIESLAELLPLELFVPLASFVEEVIAPIPSPIVMVLSGTLAYSQSQPVWYLAWLALIGAFGKTLGAWVLYAIADKLEDVVIHKFGRFLGISHKEVESIGKKLNNGWRDNIYLFLARAIPIIPSAPVSIACGIIKLNLKTFLTSTFAGSLVRNVMYLYLGYAGLGNYKDVSRGLENLESVGQLALFGLIAGIVAWSYYKRRKTSKQ